MKWSSHGDYRRVISNRILSHSSGKNVDINPSKKQKLHDFFLTRDTSDVQRSKSVLRWRWRSQATEPATLFIPIGLAWWSRRNSTMSSSPSRHARCKHELPLYQRDEMRWRDWYITMWTSMFMPNFSKRRKEANTLSDFRQAQWSSFPHSLWIP